MREEPLDDARFHRLRELESDQNVEDYIWGLSRWIRAALCVAGLVILHWM